MVPSSRRRYSARESVQPFWNRWGKLSDLVPGAEVAAQVHLRDHRQERRLAVRGASAEKYGEDKESLFHNDLSLLLIVKQVII